MRRSLKTPKTGLLVVMGGICFVLALYFAWEVLYQEPTIVKILTYAKIRHKSQNEDLEELIKDWMEGNTTKVQKHVNRDERAVAEEYVYAKFSSGRKGGRVNIHSEVIAKKSIDLSYEYTDYWIDKEWKIRKESVTTSTRGDGNSNLQHVLKNVVSRLSSKPENSESTQDNDQDGDSSIEEYTFQQLDSDTLEADCVPLNVSQPVPICIFPSEKDVYVSAQIRNTGLWEEHIVKHFEHLLKDNPTIGLFDIGANLGLYSLVAAQMGHDVIAVEPYLQNILLFQRSVQISNLQKKIVILHNAVANVNTIGEIKTHPDNQGDTRITINSDLIDNPHKNAINSSFVKTITLDDLAPLAVNFTKAIIKIDIQGYEHIAFLKASKLLELVDIPFIYMEWVLMRDFYVTEEHRSDDKDMVEQMLELLDDRGYVPYSLISGKKLKIPYWFGWSEDVLWRK